MKQGTFPTTTLLVGIMLFTEVHGFGQQAGDEQIRLRATVQAVFPLADYSGEVTPVALDPRFGLRMRIESAIPAVPELAAGAVVTFAIHSPSLLFHTEPKMGETYDFILYKRVREAKVKFVGLQRGYSPLMERDYVRWTKAQKYLATGFEPIDCFGGWVRVKGKPLKRQSFSVFSPNSEMKCCGTLVKSERTDDHGHFLVEPMQEGEYYAQFDSNGSQYVTNFAVVLSYQRCEASHVELNFSDTHEVEIQSFMDIDDSGQECQPTQPNCFRK